MSDAVLEPITTDGRPRCQGVGVKGQCKNEAGFKTSHPGDGNCFYHDKSAKLEVINADQTMVMASQQSKRRPIYDKSLAAGDPRKLYRLLSEDGNADSLKLNEELALARSTLARLQGDMANNKLETKDFYTESSRLLDTISKIAERAQPKSTLTINNVQSVLMKVIEVVHQEVNDPLIIERIIQKLATIPVVKQ